MYCPVCGTNNSAGGKFCAKCGAALQPASAAQDAASPNAAAPGAAPGMYGAPGAAPGAAPGMYGAPGAAPGMYAAPSASEGVIGAAWRDITSTQGWLKKVLLLCLIGCVPILNFAVEGYALRWARDLFLGKRETLPLEIFKKKEILTGFRAFLVRFSLGFVFGVVVWLAILLLSGLFGVINLTAGIVVSSIASILACIAYVVFYLPVINVAVTRMVVVDYLEGALNLPKVTSAFGRSMGGAIGASILPNLVAFFACFLIGLLFMLIIWLISASSVSMMQDYAVQSMYYPSSSPMGAMSGVLGMGAGVMFLFVLAIIIFSMISTFAMLVMWRAFGHWAVRTAPEWAHETDEESMLRMVDERSRRM